MVIVIQRTWPSGCPRAGWVANGHYLLGGDPWPFLYLGGHEPSLTNGHHLLGWP
jgi:hypothetical protein